MGLIVNAAMWFSRKPKLGLAHLSPPVAPAVVASGKAGSMVVLKPNQVVFLEASSSAKAVESVMATSAVVPAVKHNGVVRFIDAIGHFLVKAEPVALKVAVDLEPALAFTPFGPEWDLAVNAIVGVQKNATASIAAGVNLTNEQKFQLAVQAAQPGLTAILNSKGVTADTQTHVNNWIQVVFDLLSGPGIQALAAAVKPAA